MESALTKLLILIVSIAIAGSVIGFAWSMYSSITKTLDAEITDLQIFSTGNNFRVMFKVKNIGSVEITGVKVLIYYGTSLKGSWETSSHVYPGSEYFYDSGFVNAGGISPGMSVRVNVYIYSNGKEIIRSIRTVVMEW